MRFTDDELEYLNSLFDLARAGSTAEIASLIDGGIPVDLTNSAGDTFLILAAYHQHSEMVGALLARQADTARVNQRGQTALAAAIFRNHAGIVEELLASGADPALGAQTGWDIADFFTLPQMQDLLARLAPRPR